MNCPNCSELVENGAAFCGNCGHQLDVHAPQGKPSGSHIAQVLAHQPQSGTRNMYSQPIAAGAAPTYALATPLQHAGEAKAVLALACGIIGLVMAVFMVLIGLTFGIAGLVLATMTRNTTHRRLGIIAVVISSAAILLSLGAWAYIIHQQGQEKVATPDKTLHSIVASDIKTPCYSTGFIDTLNVTNAEGSCDMNAFNGDSLEASTKAYKVYSNQLAAVNESAFMDFARKAVQKDVAESLPGFTINSEGADNFAGSPAYIAKASNPSTGVAVTEAIVLHQVHAGANVFVLVQASSKGEADLSTLEAQWQWH